MFNLFVLGMGVLNIALFAVGHNPLNLAAGVFAIVVFIVTSK